ncbi:MAG: RNA polymerase sigma factor [Deltaproteobacteria bacterium]|nr:RNA polymerase sigma factor [Deltaproteobacteria bacterium]
MTELKLIQGSQWLDDRQIKTLALTQRTRAFDEVVRKYRTPLLHHALYVTKNYEEAVDVCQDAFIKALHEPRFFDPDFKMKAWLFRVVSNQCFNQIRNHKRRSVLLDANPPPDSSAPRQVDYVFTSERQRLLQQVLGRLSPDHQEILTLRYYSDLSYAEIADTLQVALGTVMSRLSRAKVRLMEEMQGMEALAEEESALAGVVQTG